MSEIPPTKVVARLQRQANFVRDKEFFLLILQRFLIVLLIGSLLLIFVAIYFLYYDYYFASGRSDLQSNLLLSVNNPKYQEQTIAVQAEQLRVTSNKVLENYKKNYDLLSFMTNPNDDWYAMIDYHFQSGGYTGEQQRSFILPKQNRPFWDLNVSSSQKLSSSKIVIDNVDWMRASRYDELRSEYWNFSLDDIKLTRGKDLAEAEEDISRLKFLISNESIYNFWELGLAISLKRYDELVAFYYYELKDFIAGEEREIDLTFLEDLPGITDIDIVPLLNVFDEDNIYVD